jgi:uncharacterized protein (DUF1810 family)
LRATRRLARQTGVFDAPHMAEFDLQRFVMAQAPVYSRVLHELRAGRKETHWMWFIFPQLAGLGRSAMAQRYAIRSLEEARAFLSHRLLGARLHECTEAMLSHYGGTADAILGTVDAMKFRSSMTLFDAAAEDPVLFTDALEAFYEGQRDPETLRLLAPQ